jgi:thymidylate synthase (FAD)
MVRIISEPTVILLASQELRQSGLDMLAHWVADYRPECLPDGEPSGAALFPHDGLSFLSSNELLVELAGRSCYHSYGAKAGKKTNAKYIANTQRGDIPHASIMYHAKMTFFLAGISRRVSHELIRHYVGADRDEEGSPSQESTRYTEHPGHFALHPTVQDAGATAIAAFRESCEVGYGFYRDFILQKTRDYEDEHGNPPTGMDRKRIYEAAAGLLPMQACTSMMWTTNPVALAKLFRERAHGAADREFQRLAYKWWSLAISTWPNLFQDSYAAADK